LKERKEQVAIIGGASQNSTYEPASGKRKSESQGLLNVERGEGRGNWFQGFGMVPHKKATTWLGFPKPLGFDNQTFFCPFGSFNLKH